MQDEGAFERLRPAMGDWQDTRRRRWCL